VAAGASALFGALWPAIPDVVPEAHVGLALGLVTAVQVRCKSE